MRTFKNILALSWIAVLVFALSGRTVHVFFEEGHEHEFVCEETSTHIHEKEHSCFICEFELQLSDGFTCSQPSVDIIAFHQRVQTHFHEAVPVTSSFYFTSRGPPQA